MTPIRPGHTRLCLSLIKCFKYVGMPRNLTHFLSWGKCIFHPGALAPHPQEIRVNYPLSESLLEKLDCEAVERQVAETRTRERVARQRQNPSHHLL